MTDADLQKMGVSALGARRKRASAHIAFRARLTRCAVLKVFEVVRAKENIPTPAGLTIPAASTSGGEEGSPNPDESVDDDGASSHA